MVGAITQIEDHKGDHYYDVMKRVHETINPRSYLEIGTRTGRLADPVEMRFGRGRSKIPHHLEYHWREAGLLLLPNDKRQVFQIGRYSIDHRRRDRFRLPRRHASIRVSLRDFYNTEKLCGNHSIIALHDCLPPDVRYTSRYEGDTNIRKDASHPHWWAGDVWKVPVILRRFRPDLHIVAVDAAPTGLILVTNLDPTSKVLESSYRAIVNEFSSLSLESMGLDKLSEELGVISTARLRTFEDIAQHLSA